MKRAIFIIILFTIGCRDDVKEPARFSAGIAEATSKSFVIPKLLKEEIEKRYIESFRESFPKDLRSESDILQNVPRDFLDVDLFVWQSREGTLKDNFHFNLVRGGGALDLSRIIDGDKGSLYLKVVLKKTGRESESLENYRVYFMSNAKKQIIDGESYGAGCGKVVDITKRIRSAEAGDPIRANVTDHRHVPALTGIYYFAHFAGEVIHLAALSIEDSKFPSIKCPIISTGQQGQFLKFFTKWS